MTTDTQVKDFIERWAASSAHERGNCQPFFIELCALLDVEPPDPAAEKRPEYCFEKGVKIVHADGAETTGFVDFYKRGYFVIEAKQGSEAGDAKIGTARRGTEGWRKAMRAAFGQAHRYAHELPEGLPPFLITCDVGHVFEVWRGFSGHYGDYGARKTIPLADLAKPKTLEFFRLIFTEPSALDPSLKAARVTREVAGHLAELARELEPKHGPEATSAFLMRCIFTMFAEDVALIPEGIFTKATEDHWIPTPETFQDDVSRLWEAMDKGLPFGFGQKLLQFNGGLFASTEALPLTRAQLERLLEAARCDWADVEPTIFGTLVERALDPVDRERLGAHFTPREYIERLIRPAVMEPLREDWTVALGLVRQIMDKGDEEPPEKEKEEARKILREFHAKLCKVRILDPACGSGNFLYVTFSLMKALEWEVLRELIDLGETQVGMEMEQVSVNPSQFAGLEVNPRAREIADLVLWIGYLQWHRRARGDVQPVEPVLREYKNIVCTDAVLAWDDRTERLDDEGNPVTVWDMRTYKESPVTREMVPDETARAPVYDYTNACEAVWPEADFVVSNPPFVGNKMMRKALGDGYSEALRQTYKRVPGTADLVMFWWDKAARLARAGRLRRFGFITTNSITQTSNRKVMLPHLAAKKAPLAITWAIPDHPWVADGADVRISMTVGVRADRLRAKPTLGEVAFEGGRRSEGPRDRPIEVKYRGVQTIHPDLSGGANVAGARPLLANQGLSFMGMTLIGKGFRLSADEVRSLGYDSANLPTVIRPHMNARELTQKGTGAFVIDLFGLSAEEARDNYPTLYQRLLERVKPERDQNKDRIPREKWWIFGRPRPDLRDALDGLAQYITTPETSKHRFFVFAPSELCPDHALYAVALDDPFVLGVLSSRFQSEWSLAAGSWMGIGNDPRWRNARCFDPFPFPDATDDQKVRIRDIAERLDAHRKRVTGWWLDDVAEVPMAADARPHAGRTPTTAESLADQDSDARGIHLTAMYNALERLRQIARGEGPPLTDKERAFHDAALIGVLKSLHDDLDGAVADAYGWPADLDDEEILERLVALNAQRAAEEAAGYVRWLRPEFQAPDEVKAAEEQITLVEEVKPEVIEAIERVPWPKGAATQLAAVRDLLAANEGTWTVETVAGRFTYAHKATVQRHLETLEVLGLLVGYDEGEERRWTVKEMVQ